MNRYLCRHCKALFEGEDAVYETSDIGIPQGMARMLCPECGDDDITALTRCMCCENESEDIICAECRSRLERRMKNIIPAFFKACEIEALNTIYDGRNFP